MYLLPIIALASALPTTQAWGSLGHRTTAYLSSLYFTPHTTHITNHLLHAQDISEASLFPDKIRYIPSFAYTAGWHYIDALDDPPHLCSINMTRDCALETGCVVSAIANHTSRVTDASLPFWQRGQSLRFMLHFFGDVHQPLHTEAEDRGGNEYAVVFDGKTTNLHSVWDTLIPNKIAGMGHEDEELAAWTWAQRLFRMEDDDDEEEEEEEEGWRAEDVCVDDAAECALEWAGEANKWVCDYVLAKDVHGLDLAGEYFEEAVPIVEDMIRKGGRRLGVWMNMILEGVDVRELERDKHEHELELELEHDLVLQIQ
jgi:hypothetical protein